MSTYDLFILAARIDEKIYRARRFQSRDQFDDSRLRRSRRDSSNLTESSARYHGRSTRGMSELGVVVPTGFEPVFKP